MLASSLRRAMRTTTSSHSASAAIVAFPNLLVPTTTSITTSSRATRRRGAAQQHQRRYSSSSSKPPVPPNDGSRPIDASSSQQAPANPSAGRKVKESQGRKAGAGAAGDVTKSRQSSAALLNLPSVPSTQDTPVEDIKVASFFSIHRPISVSAPVPPTSTEKAFNTIFEANKSRRGNRAADVLNTLTSAVASMEHAMHGQSQQNSLRHAVTQASVSNGEAGARIIHLDEVSEEELHASIAEFASRLTPFQPPAAPEPYNPEDVLEAAEAATGNDDADIRTYSTVLTIRETAYADGQRTFETSFAPLVPSEEHNIEEPVIDAGKSYIERTVNRTMYTISVRRQRKLKMKKHKFKKLLRKTRTLRRKLDKA
ncbi:hypothetical protein TMatcc_010071 [Talaromyces marneffei ATCC 18224]|uniref:Small ribosomal subunit protein mS38 n=1 Tax=Talaromyces marneffei (strain ATCC 18224 / CBS 334.59 / QM 7333) TaxID=441960 RepID=B6QUA8_TALMQ|nr:uncharacterized protein EYB26_009275 [Talaromyces marneffei]EEA19927.1 conserved hypothetical protein [Talaromyces marneffei ATCC 18224]KAE8548217.1 hypothetical protein EYB25_010011 [Talaromyces marneffei]QGA21564.1 hypothetical protein EYB26_009275 [Talaromyces marneffei]